MACARAGITTTPTLSRVATYRRLTLVPVTALKLGFAIDPAMGPWAGGRDAAASRVTVRGNGHPEHQRTRAGR